MFNLKNNEKILFSMITYPENNLSIKRVTKNAIGSFLSSVSFPEKYKATLSTDHLFMENIIDNKEPQTFLKIPLNKLENFELYKEKDIIHMTIKYGKNMEFSFISLTEENDDLPFKFKEYIEKKK